MSKRYPESEWYIKDGVRYRKEAIDVAKSTAVKRKKLTVKASDIAGGTKEAKESEVPKDAKTYDEAETKD